MGDLKVVDYIIKIIYIFTQARHLRKLAKMINIMHAVQFYTSG